MLWTRLGENGQTTAKIDATVGIGIRMNYDEKKRGQFSEITNERGESCFVLPIGKQELNLNFIQRSGKTEIQGWYSS